jgi:hypothetical protein
MTNLLPAGKNIGTTHITNGCYRLHPVEWNVGEVAGALAAFCLREQQAVHAVADEAAIFANFERALVASGVETRWPQPGPY